MSVTCDTGIGGCSITCAGDCCYAYYFPDTGVCVKGCCDESIENIRKQFDFKIILETKVYLSVAGIEIWKLGCIFDQLLPGEIQIPAKIADEKIKKSMQNVTVKHIIETLGLKYI